MAKKKVGDNNQKVNDTIALVESEILKLKLDINKKLKESPAYFVAHNTRILREYKKQLSGKIVETPYVEKEKKKVTLMPTT